MKTKDPTFFMHGNQKEKKYLYVLYIFYTMYTYLPIHQLMSPALFVTVILIMQQFYDYKYYFNSYTPHPTYQGKL